VYPGGTEFPGTEVCGNGPGGTTDTGLSLSDDDCDGTIDEGYDLDSDVNNCGGCGNRCAFDMGVTQPNAVLVCNDGDCEIGACVGNFVDINDDYGDGCEAACNFTGNEICDGQDNDCNGVVDDGITVPQQVCIPRRVGVCNVPQLLTLGPKCVDGMVTCDVQGVVNAGHITNYQANEMRCDGADNDCDGTVDDGYNIGAQCDNGAQGACRRTGTIACTSTSAAACNAAAAGMSTAEVCDGIDNNCDGTVDNFGVPGVGGSAVGNVEVVNLGAADGNVLVMAYEASRPNATAASAGTLTNKPCSVEGVKPWTNVTWAEARAACCSLNANGLCAGDNTGWRLCDASTFQNACDGPQANPCTWGYSTTVACDHAFNSTAYENLCHGAESMEDDVVTCADGSQSCETVTGSNAFAQCYANWTGGPISDLSGNVQEWTNTIRTAQVEQCRTFVKTGLPQNVPDNGTLSSTLSVPAYGTVTNVRVLNFTGDHTSDDMDDADVFLVSPAGTTLTLFQDRCDGDDAWAMDLQDGATNVSDSDFCSGNTVGGNINTAWAPTTAFSTLDGQSDSGTWTLQVRDDDSGGGNLVLQSWTLEVCSAAPGDSGYRDIRGGGYNDVEAGRTCSFDFEIGSTSFRFPTTGFRCCRY
jgi:subtilisin-like proprotein convertase family protein